MRRLFGMMSDQVQVTGQQLQTWWAALSPDPRTWVPFTWVLAGVVLVLLVLALVRPRRRAGTRRPELLISHGELRVAGWGAPTGVTSLAAPEGAAFELSMTVSNLSASPVQLLELAVHTNRASAATSAEVAAVLPPHGAVDVTAELPEAGGDEGVLDLFVYVPDMPPKTFRVRAKLLWEPWNARYRVLPLDQRVDVARGFGERAQRRRQTAAWRRAGPAPAAVASARGAGRPAYDEQGRFEPRPEFVVPRPERDAPAPAGRDAPRARVAPAAPAADATDDEPTWPDARPAREARRARVPGAAGAAAAGDEERHDVRDDVRGDVRDDVREDAGGDVREDAGNDARAWRLGDADRLDERAGERAGLGRAARAARGTERDGAGAGGAAVPPRRPGRPGESERPRRWAVRSDAPTRAGGLGPGELVGPDEEEADGADPAGALAEGDAEPRGAARGGDRGAGGHERSRGGPRHAGDAAAERATRDATDDAPGNAAAEAADEAAEGAADEAGDDDREASPRPRLEFPDEF